MIMKNGLKLLLSVCCLAVSHVQAATIFFDDFQQFASGTDLTGTNYFPNIGIDAVVKTNDNSGASTTIVASNFLGSVRAFYNLGNPPYDSGYRGGPLGAP